MQLIIIIVPNLQFDKIVRLQWQTKSALFKIILLFITDGMQTFITKKKKERKEGKLKIHSTLRSESNIAYVNTIVMRVNE